MSSGETAVEKYYGTPYSKDPTLPAPYHQADLKICKFHRDEDRWEPTKKQKLVQLMVQVCSAGNLGFNEVIYPSNVCGGTTESQFCCKPTYL